MEEIAVVFNKTKNLPLVPCIVLLVFVRLLVLGTLAGGAVFGQDLAALKSMYYKAVDGDRDAGARAAEGFDRLRTGGREDEPLLLAYRGSLYLLESSWAMAPWRKGKLAKQGLTMMDKAVSLAPQDVEVRFVRAATTMRLPGIFRRGDESDADFATLAPLVAAAVRSGKLEPRLGTAALHSHAVNRDKAGDRTAARTACKEAIAIGPETPGAAACRKRLASE